ncbi:MAG: helix-turn-helix transcriptional regulator [Solirubrobacteraceae bacterium]|jgi:DNA-binding NarL/FixJ family response regulator
MSSTVIEQQPTLAAALRRERIALIAGEGRCEVTMGILAILAREGLALTFFDCVQALTETDGTTEPSVIVLCLEEAISCVASLIEPLRTRFERAPVVLAYASIQRREVRAALAAGAAGVVVYDELDRSLGPCLQAVQAGQICVPREHWRQIEPPALSTREREVLGLVAMGYMNSQIAGRLFLSQSTVKSHLSSAFRKLGVRSRNEAVDLIVNHDRGLGVGILGLAGEPSQELPPMAPW